MVLVSRHEAAVVVFVQFLKRLILLYVQGGRAGKSDCDGGRLIVPDCKGRTGQGSASIAATTGGWDEAANGTFLSAAKTGFYWHLQEKYKVALASKGCQIRILGRIVFMLVGSDRRIVP